MTLDAYLALPGNSATALALKANTSTATITRVLHGEQQPSTAMIRSIVSATGGKVTAHDLVFGLPRQRNRAEAA